MKVALLCQLLTSFKETFSVEIRVFSHHFCPPLTAFEMTKVSNSEFSGIMPSLQGMHESNHLRKQTRFSMGLSTCRDGSPSKNVAKTRSRALKFPTNYVRKHPSAQVDLVMPRLQHGPKPPFLPDMFCGGLLNIQSSLSVINLPRSLI